MPKAAEAPALPLADLVGLLTSEDASCEDLQLVAELLVEVTGGRGASAARHAALLLASGGADTRAALGAQLVALGAVQGLVQAMDLHPSDAALCACSAAALRNLWCAARPAPLSLPLARARAQPSHTPLSATPSRAPLAATSRRAPPSWRWPFRR